MVEFLRKRLVLVNEFHRDRERTRYILIVGANFVVAIKMMVHWTDFQRVRLQRDADGDLLSPARDRAHHLDFRTMARSFMSRRAGRQPTTFSALRHAAACGAGSGGSYGASGGLSGFEGVGTVSLRITDSSLPKSMR
jgi:hypothetical protein